MVGLLDSQLSELFSNALSAYFRHFTNVGRHSGRIKLKDGNHSIELKMVILDNNDDVSLFAHSCKNTVIQF